MPTPDSRTFHSTPSSRAARDRFEDPTYAVSNPVVASNSHALACSRVRCSVVLHPDLGPEVADQSVERVRSVAPMYVVVMTRSGARARAAGELGLQQPQAVPLHEGAEQVHLVAVSSSARSSAPRPARPARW